MKKQISYVLTGIAIATLAACGGGGGAAGTSTPSLSGTIAVGAPVEGAVVTLTDGTSTIGPVTTATDGSYKFLDVSKLKGSVMLEATGTVNGKDVSLHSVLESVPTGTTSGVLNATPATEAVTAQVLKKDPTLAFKEGDIKNIDIQKFSNAKLNLRDALAPVLKDLGQDSTKVDLFTSVFTANNTGLDKLLDTVSFDTTSESTDRSTIRVTNKVTNSEVTINSVGTTGTLTSAPIKTEEIKVLMSNLNDTIRSADSIRSTAMSNLINSAYLQEGINKSQVIELLATEIVGGSYTSFTLEGCKVSTADTGTSASPTCNVNFSIKLKDGTTAVDSTAVIYDGSKWQLYGDQSTFKFDLKPVVNAQYSVVNGTLNNTSKQMGMNLYIPTSSNIASAELFYSTDKGSNWLSLQKFTTGTGNCTPGYLILAPTITASSADCTNFFTVSEGRANTFNSATPGNYLLKIETYANANWTEKTNTHLVSGKKLFNEASAEVALKNSGLSIKATDLGTASVNFTGINVDYLDIKSTYTASSTAMIEWDDSSNSSISALKNVVNISKANALCKAKSSTDQTCDTKFGNSSVINGIMLSKRDALGRAVWVSYSKYQ